MNTKNVPGQSTAGDDEMHNPLWWVVDDLEDDDDFDYEYDEPDYLTQDDYDEGKG